MAPTARQRFERFSDWHDFVTGLRQAGNQGVNLYELRSNCYRDIEALRGRPLLVYAVNFPITPLPIPNFPQPPISIDFTDVDGFTDLVAGAEGHDAIDVLITSPGGSPEATERIVDILRATFSEVSFLVPHSAYSAATMLCLSGDEIILHPSATLGPIDPQVNGIPARALKRGFDNARKAVREEGPEALPVYVPLIEKHSLELFEICEDYEKLSRQLAGDWLSRYMFKSDPEKQALIDEAVEFFSAYENHKTHSRSLTFSKVTHLGLKISRANNDLSRLLREAHVLLKGFFDVSNFVKLYENSRGLSWGRQFEVSMHQAPPPPGT